MVNEATSDVRPGADAAKLQTGPSWGLEFLLLMVVCFVMSGAPAPHVNETHYFLKAKHYWDPSFCPGDLFLDSKDAHLPFFWTVGWLTRVVPLDAATWIARFAAWALVSAGWLRLVHAITRVRWAGLLSGLVWLVLVDRFDFAGEWVVGGLNGRGGVEGKCFAYGFVLFGLAALAEGRWTAPWIWFGAAAAMHALVGGWAVLAALGVWLTGPRTDRPAFRSLLPGLLLGGLLALPGLLPAVALDRGATAADSREAARIYVYERLPHHLAPHTLAEDEFGRRVLRFGLLVAAFVALATWSAIQSSPSVTRGQPDLWQPDALGRIIRFATMALIGNSIGMAIELTLDHNRPLAASLLRYYWYRQADVIVPAAVALGATCLGLELLRRSQPWGRLAVAAATLACSAHLMVIAVDRWRNPYPPAVGRMQDVDAWLAACDWIREHAPADAMCLIPRHAQSFKWFAQRADVVNWKDVPQDPAGVIEWRRRIHDIYPTVSTPEGPLVLNSPEQWGARRVLEVARRYGATYIVARSEPPLGLDEVFAANSNTPEGGGYAVYKIDAAPQTEGASLTP